jgi:hypothetical protein
MYEGELKNCLNCHPIAAQPEIKDNRRENCRWLALIIISMLLVFACNVVFDSH